MRIQVGGDDGTRVFTEVPDDETKEKGLYERKAFEVHWRHSDNTTAILGHFYLEPMPGCCGIVVSTGSYLEPKQRGSHNVSRWFHELKALTAKHFGYTTMLMTTHLRNIPEVVGASHAKWKFFHYFRNSRTNNDIGIAVKDL